MASSFKGVNLFGSGPHRFAMAGQGMRAISLAAVADDPTVEGSAWFGDLELEVHVRGRLVAASESALWTLRDAITAQADSDNTPVPGTLIDLHGRTWTSMSLYRYEEAGSVDRGRVWSVGYLCRFRQFIGT
ncbi:MAG: hypothetical protein R3B57_07015 [Phycisphaerales bacterium]